MSTDPIAQRQQVYEQLCSMLHKYICDYEIEELNVSCNRPPKDVTKPGSIYREYEPGPNMEIIIRIEGIKDNANTLS